MMYKEFNVGNKEYKLRLGVRNMVILEKQLGCNPLSIFGDGDEIPTVTTMVTIFYYSLLQYNHGIGLEKAYEIFEEWLSEGNTVTDFIPIIIDIYKVSGIIKQEESENTLGNL